MKNIISLFVLFPLFIFAMDMQGPVTHCAEDHISLSVSARQYPFDFIKSLTPEKLSIEKEALIRNSAFREELPLLIDEAQTYNDFLEGEACVKKCCVYSKCVVKAGLIGCISGYIANITHNINAGEWLCLAGTSAACYQCNSELKRDGHMRSELQTKLALLQRARQEAAAVESVHPIVTRDESMETYEF